MLRALNGLNGGASVGGDKLGSEQEVPAIAVGQEVPAIAVGQEVPAIAVDQQAPAIVEQTVQPVEAPVSRPASDDEYDDDRCSRSTMSTASLVANGCMYTILEQMLMTTAADATDGGKINVASLLSQLVSTARSTEASLREIAAASRGQEAAFGAIAEALRDLAPLAVKRPSRSRGTSRRSTEALARAAEGADAAAAAALGNQ